MQMVSSFKEIVNGKPVYRTVTVHIPHEDLPHPEREDDLCAVCISPFYPDCTEKCGMLKGN